MAAAVTGGLRRCLVAAFIFALVLVGSGRGVAQAAGAHGVIPGAHLPICRSGGGKVPADPARPASRQCCDDRLSRGPPAA